MSTHPDKRSIGTRQTLILELKPAAHSAGYLKALLNISPDRQASPFSIAAVICDADNPEMAPILSAASHNGYNVFTFPTDKSFGLRRYYQILRSLPFLFQAERLCKKLKPQAVYILYLDSVLPWLAGRLGRIMFPSLTSNISGIVFNAHCFRENLALSRKKQIVASWDRFFIRKALESSHFSTVHFLDHDIVPELPKLVPKGAAIAGYSADPWTTFKRKDKVELARELGLQPNDFAVLSFGSQAPRKGTLWIIKALEILVAEDPTWRLVLAGPISESFRVEIDQALKESKLEGRTLIFNRYFTDAESWKLFQAADIVACPYIGFYGSSNVTIRACAAGTPVVVNQSGVMEDAARRFKFGECINGSTPKDLADALRLVRKNIAADPEAYRPGCEAYADLHSEERFREQCTGI